MTLQSVGFVGAGLIGAGMAGCLLAAGHSLSVPVHKNRAPVDPLLAQGATEVKDAVALVHGAEVLNHLVTQGTTIFWADGFQCADTVGVDKSAFCDVMMAGAARSGTLEKAVRPALQGKYDGVQFTIENAAKDPRDGRDLIAALAPDCVPVAEGRGAQFVSTMPDPNQS